MAYAFSCPRSTQFAPNANFQWITFTAWELKVSHSYGGLENVVEVGAMLGTFRFLMPEDYSESVSHSWNEIDNIAGDIATKFTEVKQKTVNAEALSKGIVNYTAGENVNGTELVKQIGDQSRVIQNKVDGALVYTDSTKRDYTFTFELVNQGDAMTDVVSPIKALMSLSCARQLDALKIDFPAVFSITTDNNLINVKHAALDSVQANYKGGYDKEGMPIYAELTLSFKEIEPLYRHRVDMDSAGVITTKPTASLPTNYRDARTAVAEAARQTNEKYGGR